MRIPVLPLGIAASLIGIVVYLFNSASSGRKPELGKPRIEHVVDVEGDETEIAAAPDGTRLLAVSSGDLWIVNLADRSRKRLTATPEPEAFPAWTPDGRRITFTRGPDTWAARGPEFQDAAILKPNATSLSWSASGRATFVRDRALWVTDASGVHDRELAPADANLDITTLRPRFSPDSLRIAYIRTMAGLQGEVWVADASSGAPRAVVADRWAENPLDVGWLGVGGRLVYLTNRSGGYALWIVDFAQNTLGPLTPPLDGIYLGSPGMAATPERIYIVRHALNSDVVTADGRAIAASPNPEFEPAASPDGRLVAYTVYRNNRFEIWTAAADGANPAFRILGTQPRFAPNGFELVFTHTDLEGHVDLRKLDIRDGSSSVVTDAGETDFQSDWSPDGRTIVLASGKDGVMALWSIPASGGKRTRLTARGFHPRIAPDGRRLAFWSEGALWTANLDGRHATMARSVDAAPMPGVWMRNGLRTYADADIRGSRELLPVFDVLPDGRPLVAALASRQTAVWTVTPTYLQP